MPDIRIADVFRYLVGREPASPQEVLRFMTVYNEAVRHEEVWDMPWPPDSSKRLGDVSAKWSPTGYVVDSRILDALEDITDATKKFRTVFNAAMQDRSAVQKAISLYPVEFDQSVPMTAEQVAVLDTSAYAKAQKSLEASRTPQNPMGVYPSFEQLLTTPERIALTEEQNKQAERAYYTNLRNSGVYPTKTPEFEAELAKRFKGILEDYATGYFGDMTPQEFIGVLGEPQTFPGNPEAEFTAKYKEKQQIGEKFTEAWDRLLSTKGIDVPEELQTGVKALLGKAYIDAAFQNPATTQAENVIVAGLKGATEQAQTQRQAGFREDALNQLVQEGDYDRAARLVGPPPGAETVPAASAPDARVQEAIANSPEEIQVEVPELQKETQERERVSAAAVADLPTFANARVISEAAPYRAEVDRLIASEKDPGYRKFVQEQAGAGETAPGFLGLRQGFQQSFREGDKTFDDFAGFVGREFEKLRPQYQETPVVREQRRQAEADVKQQQKQQLAEENRQERSFRTSLLTRRR